MAERATGRWQGVKELAQAGGNAYSDFNRSVGVSPKNEIAGQFARGNIGRGVVNAAYGAPGWEVLTDLLSGPKRQVLGGSQQALDARRASFQSGAASGASIVDAGLGYVDRAAGMADTSRSAADSMMGQGAALGSQALFDQHRAVNAARGFAGADTASVAEAQMQQGLAQTRRSMMADAANVRGGNQAAALMSAQNTGAQAALDVNAQAGLLRRQEAVDRLNRQMGVEQMAAGLAQGRAGMGFGLQQSGLGYGMQAGGQIGQLGGAMSGIGSGREQLYTQAGLDADKAQLEYDARLAGADVQRKAGIIGAIGGGIAKMYGAG